MSVDLARIHSTRQYGLSTVSLCVSVRPEYTAAYPQARSTFVTSTIIGQELIGCQILARSFGFFRKPTRICSVRRFQRFSCKLHSPCSHSLLLYFYSTGPCS